jgi:hypothetical protein
MLPKSMKASICRQNTFFESQHLAIFTINLGSQISKAMHRLILIRANYYEEEYEQSFLVTGMYFVFSWLTCKCISYAAFSKLIKASFIAPCDRPTM